MGMAGLLAAVWFWTAPAQPMSAQDGPVVDATPEPEPEPVAEPEPEVQAPSEAPVEPSPEVSEEGTTEEPVEALDDPPEEAASERVACVPNSQGITQLGPRKWKVKRSVIERYTGNSASASKLAKVKWAKNKSGKTVGVRLLRVPCKSPLKAAGLRSKDLILEVDGKKVTSYAQGLRVWASIRRNSAFTVKLKRGGQTLTHRYLLD
jgi:membrane-associated protease RseP (regulator of RpoE activity)